MSKALNIVFAGTPDFAAVALQHILQSRHRVLAVYSQPDRAQGRGRKLLASAVKTVALKQQIPVYQPENFKSQQTLVQLDTLRADVMVVAAYGLLLPPSVLQTPKFGCINIHASLLPRWRGAAPIQRAILAGDKKTGISIMQMDKGLDTGAILKTIDCTIEDKDSADNVHDKLALLGGRLILETLDDLQNNTLQVHQQDDSLSTYAKKLSKQEASINWFDSAINITRQIRALNSWPVAETSMNQQILRLWQAQQHSISTDLTAGTIIRADKTGLLVACGEGSINITHIQRKGGKAMAVADFLNGHANMLKVGTMFD